LSRLAAPTLPVRDWGSFVVAAGRLDRQKGHDVLLQAVAEVRASGLDLGVVILGEGPEREALETLVRRLGLSDRALLPGRIGAPHRVYRLATIFAHPSRWEGFGMSLLEAMAVGAPVIATSCPGGPKEILDGQRYGLLVPPDDPKALATAIASLIRDEALRSDLGAKARLRARAYAPRKVADKMIQALTPYLR
jgi:glycosyltransferase involved in cell wall biosynthesis